jgi:hypothetical protein
MEQAKMLELIVNFLKNTSNHRLVLLFAAGY